MVGTLSTVTPNMTITSGVSTPVQVVGYGSGSRPARNLPAVEQRQWRGRLVRLAGRLHALEHRRRRRDRAGPGADDLRHRRRDDVRGDQRPDRFADRLDQSAGNLQHREPRRRRRRRSRRNFRYVAGGPAVAGFSWNSLSSQSIGGGNWSGSIANVPPGIYWVSVRAANGTSYATMRNFVTVGASSTSPARATSAPISSTHRRAEHHHQRRLSPPIRVSAVSRSCPAGVRQVSADDTPRRSRPTGSPSRATAFMSEGMTNFAQTFFNATGVGVGVINAVIVGTGSMICVARRPEPDPDARDRRRVERELVLVVDLLRQSRQRRRSPITPPA